jgi:streptogramin lyase
MWAMGYESPRLYRLDANQGQICTFLLPMSARAYYVVHAGGYLWLGDTYNERLLRLTVSDNSLRSWTLPEFSSPFGMTVDGQGNLWYADASNNVLARLSPATDQLAVYELPAGAFPQMITFNQDLIWYTGIGSLNPSYPASLGYLDPLIAAPIDPPFIPTVENSTLTPDCVSIAPSGSGSLTTTSGNLAWSPASYSPIQQANGWWIYQLPTGSAPYGIASTSSVWFVDTSRRVLGRIPTGPQVTACKLQDLDQNPLTTGDRIPVRNWTLYLTIGGVRQTPAQVTGSDGCTTWLDLAPDLEYGVEEDLPSEWQALTATSHSFGVAGPLAQLSHTFINGREMKNLYLPVARR